MRANTCWTVSLKGGTVLLRRCHNRNLCTATQAQEAHPGLGAADTGGYMHSHALVTPTPSTDSGMHATSMCAYLYGGLRAC